MTDAEREACQVPRRRRAGGRARGTPNKATRELRESICQLLDANADKMAVWLDAVAQGDPEQGRPADPARALELLAQLAEFAVPKLARVSADEQARTTPFFQFQFAGVAVPS